MAREWVILLAVKSFSPASSIIPFEARKRKIRSVVY